MKPNTQSISRLPLKPYSKKEIADIYKVNRKTLQKWLCPFEQEIGASCGRYYTVHQVTIIFNKLGLPGEIIAQ